MHDARWRTKHILRPTEEMVKEYLASPHESAWRDYRKAYFDVLTRRFCEDRTPFDRLVDLAMTVDVLIGCSCPTHANPRLDHCHTFLALEFIQSKYSELQVEFPSVDV